MLDTNVSVPQITFGMVKDANIPLVLVIKSWSEIDVSAQQAETGMEPSAWSV